MEKITRDLTVTVKVTVSHYGEIGADILERGVREYLVSALQFGGFEVCPDPVADRNGFAPVGIDGVSVC